MYEYKVVRFTLAGMTSTAEASEYQALLNEEARNGWRFVQALAPVSNFGAFTRFYDIVFEREVK